MMKVSCWIWFYGSWADRPGFSFLRLVINDFVRNREVTNKEARF